MKKKKGGSESPLPEPTPTPDGEKKPESTPTSVSKVCEAEIVAGSIVPYAALVLAVRNENDRIGNVMVDRFTKKLRLYMMMFGAFVLLLLMLLAAGGVWYNTIDGNRQNATNARLDALDELITASGKRSERLMNKLAKASTNITTVIDSAKGKGVVIVNYRSEPLEVHKVDLSGEEFFCTVPPKSARQVYSESRLQVVGRTQHPEDFSKGMWVWKFDDGPNKEGSKIQR